MTHSTLPRVLAIAAGLALVAVSGAPAAAAPLPKAPNCPVLPADNVWNEPVDTLPVRSDSQALKATIGLNAYLHPDFGSYAGYGIPYNVVGASAPKYTLTFKWPRESDKGPYPIPAHPKIEGASDKHMLVVDKVACKLYELYHVRKTTSGWNADSGAIWDMTSNDLRPSGWTSADAAGLPILPGLVRYDEVAAGVIDHALRFTAETTRDSWIYPARHQAGDGNDADLPPMGLRVRLKASVDISGFGPQARVVLQALKTYGMILADNGTSWYVTGASNPNFDDDDLHGLQQINGSDFEVVDTSTLRNG